MLQDRRGILVPLLRFALQTVNEKPPQLRPRLPSAGHCLSSPTAAKRKAPEASAARVRDIWWSDPSVAFFLANEITAYPPKTPSRRCARPAFFSTRFNPNLSCLTSNFAAWNGLRNDGKWPHHVVILVLEDVAMIDVGLRRTNASREIILCPDRRELAGICFHRVFETALGRIRRLHRSRRKRSRIDSTGDAVRPAVRFLIRFYIERSPPHDLELHQVIMDRMRVPGHVDVNPVLNCPNLWHLSDRSLKVYCVQIERPLHLLRVDLIEGDIACVDGASKVGRAPGQTRRDSGWPGLSNRSSHAELHHLRQLRRWIRDRTRRPVIHHHESRAGEPAEIDKHIGTLGRRHYQTSGSHWSVPHPAVGSDLPEVQTTKIDVQNPGVAAVQDSETVHARFDVEIWPHLAIDQHHVAEILADPNHAFDVARWIKEFAVCAELSVLDDERNFVRVARNSDGVGLVARVVLVAKKIGGGQSCKDVEPCRTEAVIVEPQQRCRLLVWIIDGLCVAWTEAVWRDGWVAVAVA